MGVKLHFRAFGHPLVLAEHKTTIEFTKEDFLSRKGDCIVGIRADISASEIPAEIRSLMKNDSAEIKLEIECLGVKDSVIGRGSADFTLTGRKSMVFRKSSFVDGRTVMLGADKSAKDLKRELIEKIRPDSEINCTLAVD